MKRIVIYTVILCMLSIISVFSRESASSYPIALYPYISGSGLDVGTFAKTGIEETYTVKYSQGIIDMYQRSIKWDVDPSDCQIIRTDANNATVTVKWKTPGKRCRIRAYNIYTFDGVGGSDGNPIYVEYETYVRVQSNAVGNIVLNAPERVLENNNININVEVQNTLGYVSASISGDNFISSNWVSTGDYKGYFPGKFNSAGTKTVTVTAYGSGMTSNSATKTIKVFPNTINGSDAIAYNEQETYNLVNAPADNFTWSVSTGLQIISGQGTSQVVVIDNSSYTGSGYIQVSIGGQLTVRKNIAIGVPETSKIEAEFGTNNTLYSYHTNRNECRAYYSGPGTILEFGWEAFDWEVYNPMTSNKSIIFLKAKNPGCCSTANVLLRARNSAGWSTPVLLGVQVNNSTSGQYNIQYSTDILTISENTEEINADINQSSLTRKNDDPLVYELYNINNVSLAKKGTINRTGGTIDISDLPQGIYTISLIIDSSTRQTMKIAIK